MHKLTVILVFILFAFAAKSQSISGTVTDSQTGEALPGASVFISKSFSGDVTSRKGQYSINIGQTGSYKVKASFMGYHTQEKEIDIKGIFAAHLSFELEPANIIYDEVVVTGTKVSTSRSNVPLTTSIINISQIEQSAELNLLPIISQKVPGVFVTQRGISGFGIANGSAGKISIRGVGSADQSQLLVLINGQPQFMGIFGHGFPDMYQSANVEKVELIRGPASVLYGTNAMGGVLNIITRQQQNNGWSMGLNGQYGSFNTLRGSLNTGFKSKNTSVWALAQYDQTNGHRPSSGFTGSNGHLGFETKLGQHFKLKITGMISDFKAIDPGPEADSLQYANDAHWAKVTRGNGMISLKNKHDFAEGHLNLFYNEGHHKIYDNWISTDRNYGVSLFEGLQLFENNLLGLGLDWNQYGGQGNNAEPYDIWHKVNETGAYAFMQHTFIERITINSGVRLQHHSVYGRQWLPQAGLAGKISDNNEAKIMVSKGFRSPNVKELYFFPPSNPELKPESLWNYEIGYTQYAYDKKLKANINIYYMNGENLIMTVPNPAGGFPPMKNMNSGAFVHQGGEVELYMRLMPGLIVDASYAYLHMDSPKIAAPKHQLQAGLSAAYGRFDGSLSAQHIAGLYTRLDNAKTAMIDETAISAFTTVSARLNCRVNRNTTLFVSGNNLLNSVYEINLGYPMPGISWMAGMRFGINQ